MVYFKENGGEKMTTYKTAEVAAIIGIHPNTVRLYEKLKLIPKPERLSNGYRVFTDFHIWQCRLIRLAFQIEVLQNGLRKKITRMIMVSTLSIGLLVGGIAKNMKSASVIACILYFPMLIFSGTTLPFEVMPIAMQKIISIFPLTQGIQLMKATFLGLPTENVLLPVVVMGAGILICFGISVKCFKWE